MYLATETKTSYIEDVAFEGDEGEVVRQRNLGQSARAPVLLFRKTRGNMRDGPMDHIRALT